MGTQVTNGYTGSYSWKPGFQALLRPLLGRLAGIGVTANALTVAGVSVSAGAAAALFWWNATPRVFLILPIALLVRMALNALDGMLAREYRQEGALGACLNELGDVASDAVLLAPFALLPGVSGWAIAVVAVLAALSEMAGLMAQALGGERCYDGPMGKSDRALVLALLAGWVGLSDGLPLLVAQCAPVVMAGGIAVTIVARVRGAVAPKGDPDARV